jgi:hypothetical protein
VSLTWGGPCNKGSFADLENFCKFARYYVASDLPNGGYSHDDWTIEKYLETDPDNQYHDLFASHDTLEAVLKNRIDLRRKDYEYSRNNMVTNQVAQANYLYSCESFSEFPPEFRSFFAEADVDQLTHGDVYQFMIENQAPSGLIELFDQVFVHKVDNRDFFTWSSVANGMLLIMESY